MPATSPKRDQRYLSVDHAGHWTCFGHLRKLAVLPAARLGEQQYQPRRQKHDRRHEFDTSSCYPATPLFQEHPTSLSMNTCFDPQCMGVRSFRAVAVASQRGLPGPSSIKAHKLQQRRAHCLGLSSSLVLFSASRLSVVFYLRPHP